MIDESLKHYYNHDISWDSINFTHGLTRNISQLSKRLKVNLLSPKDRKDDLLALNTTKVIFRSSLPWIDTV